MNKEKRRRRAKRKAKKNRIERNQGSVYIRRLLRGEYYFSERGRRAWGL